jgi:hypothetical protein
MDMNVSFVVTLTMIYQIADVYPVWPGTDVMILKIFSPENLAKKMAF